MNTRHRLLPLLIAALLLAAACGSSDDDTVSAGGGGETDPPPAAGACAEGHPDCVDTGVDPPDDAPVDDLPSDDPDTPVSSPPAGAPDDPDGPSGRPEVVEPAGDAVQVRPHPWEDLIPTDDGDDSTFLVAFYGGVEPCFIVDRVEVDETPDAVTVTVYAGSSAEAAQGEVACIEIAKYMAVQVDLAEPLGQREVIDGAD